MRRDMHKLLVEEPRYPPLGNPKGRRPPRDPEDWPRHEGMGRPHALSGATRNFGDHLAPLRRYLGKQVGRPWNKVYGEICADLRAGAVLHDHVRNHVRDFVALHVAMTGDGLPVAREARFRGERAPVTQPFFVHPRSGRLCRTPRRS
jgi:hypothetical protein